MYKVYFTVSPNSTYIGSFNMRLEILKSAPSLIVLSPNLRRGLKQNFWQKVWHIIFRVNKSN